MHLIGYAHGGGGESGLESILSYQRGARESGQCIQHFNHAACVLNNFFHNKTSSKCLYWQQDVAQHLPDVDAHIMHQ